MDLDAIREEIPGIDAVIYLNTGGFGLMPRVATQEIQDAYAALGPSIDPTSWYREAWRRAEALREQIARFVGAAADEIAFKNSVSDGYGSVLWGLDWREGDEVLVTREEHNSPRLAVELAAQRFGLKVRGIPVCHGVDAFLEEFRKALGPRTRLVAMSHVTTDSGTRLPAERICQLAHEAGALVLLDGAQSLGQFPLDLHAMGCDFYACMGYKWALGPLGTGFLYARREAQGALHPIIGASAVRWLSLPDGRFEETGTARRFEFAPRAWPEYFALGRSLEFVDRIGIARIQEHTGRLVGRLRGQLAEIEGVEIYTPEKPEECTGIVAFGVEGTAPRELSGALRERWRIAQRAAMMVGKVGGIRVSVAVYTTADELDLLVQAVREVARNGHGASAGADPKSS